MTAYISVITINVPLAFPFFFVILSDRKYSYDSRTSYEDYEEMRVRVGGV